MSLPYRWQAKLDRLLDQFRGMFRSNPQGARPRLCPACNTLVGATASRCHECGASLNFSLAAASKTLSGILPGETSVTSIIFVLNILLFGLSLLITMRASESMNLFGSIHSMVLDKLGASRPMPYMGGEWWRLVTAVFLHANLIHIGLNMMALLQIGPMVEDVYGSARYLFLYVATGAAGFLASSARGNFAIGASGALMGLIGLTLAITTRRGGAYMRAIRSRLITSIVITFIIGLTFPIIDNYAHLGGLAAGFSLGKVFEDREPMNAAERKRAYALGWIAGIVVLASFAMMLIHYFRPANRL